MCGYAEPRISSLKSVRRHGVRLTLSLSLPLSRSLSPSLSLSLSLSFSFSFSLWLYSGLLPNPSILRQIKRPTHFYDAGFRHELRPPPSTVAIKADGCGQPATISLLFIFLLACRRSGNQPYNYYQQRRNRLACPIPAAFVVMQAGRHAGRPGPDHGGMASSIPWYTRGPRKPAIPPQRISFWIRHVRKRSSYLLVIIAKILGSFPGTPYEYVLSIAQPQLSMD